MGRNSGGRARRAARAALLGALSLLILYGACLAPTGAWGLTAAAGLLPAAAVISAGLGAGFLCWGGVSLLALLLLPDKFVALLFTLLFGLYPMVKSLAEGLRRRWAGYALKLAFFNLALTALYLAMGGLLLASLPGVLQAAWLLYPVGNLVFLLYDFGFTKLIGFYIQRIHRPLSRGGR